MKFRRTLSVAMTGAIAAMVASATARADTFEWDADGGTGGNWSVAANWYNATTASEPAAPPTIADTVNLDHGHSSLANPVVVDAHAYAASLTQSYGTPSYMVINADMDIAGTYQVGGKVTAVTTHNTGIVNVGGNFTLAQRQADSQYVMTSSSAELHITGQLTMGRCDAGAASVFDQQAGVVTVDTIGNSSTGGSTYTGTSDYNLSGGSLTVNSDMKIGWKNNGYTTFRQSGGVSNFAAMNLAIDYNDVGYARAIYSDAADATVTGDTKLGGGSASDGGYGEIILDGSKTGAGTDLNLQGNLDLTDRGTVEVIIDQDAIDNPNNLRQILVGGDATFVSGSTLKVSFADGVTPTAGSWTILTATGSLIVPTDIVFDAGAGWSWSANSPLTVTYAVPEPATLATLGIGGLMMLKRRRDR